MKKKMEKMLNLISGIAQKVNFLNAEVNTTKSEHGSANTPIVTRAPVEDNSALTGDLALKVEDLRIKILQLQEEKAGRDELDLKLHK